MALSKKAILSAAASVNQFFKITSQDVWLNPLPQFHVGGLSIEARTYLAGGQTIDLESWDVGGFHKLADQQGATIASLVPTQVFDLVEQGFRAPQTLRLVIVGGGPLNKDLYFRGRELGWPLIPSYGMTETAALMAAASPQSLSVMEFPEAHLLSHVDLEPIGEQFKVNSASLFDGFLWVKESGESVWQPRPQPFVLDDRIEVQDRKIKVLGRESEIVKILGETVNLLELKNTLQIKIPGNILLLPKVESRRGYEIHLVVESEPVSLPIAEVNRDLMPYENICKVHFLSKFPRTELGKINFSEVQKQIFN